MPYKKTYKRKRPVKKTYKRRFNIPRRRMTMPKSGFLRTIRCFNLNTTFNCHALYEGNDTINFIETTAQFRLSDLPNYTELTNLFDNYRIVKVMYRWVLFRNVNADSVTLSARGVYPNLMWIHDFNDSSSVGRAQMMTNANMRELYLSDQRPATKWYSIRPSTLSTTFETGIGAPGYSPKWRQWLDTTDANVPHYGIKLNINQLFTNMVVKLETKYILEFKGVS